MASNMDTVGLFSIAKEMSKVLILFHSVFSFINNYYYYLELVIYGYW